MMGNANPMMGNANPMMGNANPMMSPVQQQQSAMQQQQSMMRGGGGANGVNPLFSSVPSPLGSQTGMGMNAAQASNLYGNAAAPASGANTPTASASQNEAEMLQQLMGEISRLKSELGVPPRT